MDGFRNSYCSITFNFRCITYFISYQSRAWLGSIKFIDFLNFLNCSSTAQECIPRMIFNVMMVPSILDFLIIPIAVYHFTLYYT